MVGVISQAPGILSSRTFISLTTFLVAGFGGILQRAPPRFVGAIPLDGGAQAFVEVPLRPSLVQAMASQNEPLAFRYCSLAVAPDGSIYFQTMSQLWAIAP